MCVQKLFERRKNYLKHLKVHEEHNKIMCQYCSKTFVFNSYLKRHIRRSHSAPQVNENQYEIDREMEVEVEEMAEPHGEIMSEGFGKAL